MRVIVGAIAGLGLAVTVAVAQQPVQRERAAVLMPPRALQPNEMPPVARGAVDDFPSSSLQSTPVTRTKGAPGVSVGPAWLTNADSNVQPAAGFGSKTGGVRPLTPPAGMQPKDDPSIQPKFGERLKGTMIGGKPGTPQPLSQPFQQPEQPTASTPFRSTGTNGAPVFAGPPAYRWYGWGSVTPGANPLAPAGQYPKASANWYSITGATPGAFPVPVSNTARPAPGMDPPAYGLARTTPQPVVPVVSQQQPQYQPQHQPHVVPSASRPDVPTYNPAPESKFMPGSSIGAAPPGPAPVAVPTITPPPTPKPVTITPVARPEPVAVLPPLPNVPVIPSVEPEPLALPTTEPKAATTEPKPLPPAVTTDPPREERQWKPASEPSAPQPGTWAPAPGMTPLPTQPTQPVQPSSWQSAGAKGPVVARGQMDNDKPDAVVTLIKQVCQDRANGVEVRWTGTKKLQVCFEIRTQTEAQKLVNDISKRPELTAFQIDFCVLVK